MKKHLLHFVFTVFSCYCTAQDLDYAKSVIDTLTSPGMHGRGYVYGGNKIAAKFIEDGFKINGLKPFGDSYLQEFTLPVNTFPGEMEILIDKNILKPGVDYLVAPYSKSYLGNFNLFWFDELVLMEEKELARFLKKSDAFKFIVIDKSEIEKGEELKLFQATIFSFNAKGIVVISDNLTWGLSQKTEKLPVIEILRKNISRDSKSININIENQFLENDTTQNVIGFVEGAQIPDSFIVFSAHYDHLGRIGKDTWFPGANDNASGTAMLLNLARHYAENPTKYSIVFIAFGAEEVNLLGSEYYTNNPLFPLSKIKFLINMDLMGTGDEGVTIVNGAVLEDEFNTLVDINKQKQYLVEIKKRGKAANSDHYHFSERRIKAFFIYTMGGIKAYHDVYDKAETLPLTEFEDVFRLLVDFVETF
ncbi:MAG: M28 family peptidase [Bacteroidota bacterium]